MGLAIINGTFGCRHPLGSPLSECWVNVGVLQWGGREFYHKLQSYVDVIVSFSSGPVGEWFLWWNDLYSLYVSWHCSTHPHPSHPPCQPQWTSDPSLIFLPLSQRTNSIHFNSKLCTWSIPAVCRQNNPACDPSWRSTRSSIHPYCWSAAQGSSHSDALEG